MSYLWGWGGLNGSGDPVNSSSWDLVLVLVVGLSWGEVAGHDPTGVRGEVIKPGMTEMETFPSSSASIFVSVSISMGWG